MSCPFAISDAALPTALSLLPACRLKQARSSVSGVEVVEAPLELKEAFLQLRNPVRGRPVHWLDEASSSAAWSSLSRSASAMRRTVPGLGALLPLSHRA